MKKLFGTDGIRGLAGEFPLDEPTVSVIGASLASRMAANLGRHPRFVIGRDTRESGRWIEEAFAAGVGAENAACSSAGVITTPGVAYLTREFDFDAGVVISASHNPFEDNGIKIFSPSGKKIDEQTERAIEADIASSRRSAAGGTPADSDRAAEFSAAYLEHLLREGNGYSLAGIKIVLDCANGAASGLAPELFSRLGCELVVMHAEPDGRNINRDCGSLHLEGLQRRVVAEGADLGIAFDGDADRALFVEENGRIIDGDATLWIMAGYLQDHGRLTGSTVVATVMSNIGLEIALRSRNIELLRTSVGDKHVLDKLIETGTAIGGEQSGHIIFPQISLVGDGMMTALLLLRAMREKGTSLSSAAAGFVPYPQILVNTKVREKRPFEEVDQIAVAARQVEGELGDSGRLLLRYSGTENLARVMIEGADQSAIEEQARMLSDVIRRALG